MDLRGTTPEVVDALAGWLGAVDPEPLVVETSGSSGRPKRVVLAREAVLASVAATAARLGDQGGWLLTLPASYVAGAQVVCRSLVAGHAPVLAEDHGSFVEATAELVRRTGPEAPRFCSLVPTQVHRMLADPDEVWALRAYRTVLVGGGPLDPDLRERAARAGVPLVATYGSAETAGGCVYDGRPLDGVEVAIGDDRRIRIGGPTLFSGYEDDPGLSAEVLVDGWFLTSDAGRLDRDGRLQVLGRVDDMVVTGGVNVPAPAVAQRLRRHPDVDQAEVLGVPDPEWGSRLVAFVVAADAPPSLDALRDWVGAEHPRAWAPRQLVVLRDLPLLANGKTDREALRRAVAEQAAR